MDPRVPATLARAPSWARWIAQDADGAWWAYEAQPLQQEHGWYENEVGRCVHLGHGPPNSHWHRTLARLGKR